MIEFLKTPAGKRFFDRDLPNLTKAINRAAAALEKHEGVSLQSLMQGLAGPSQDPLMDPEVAAMMATMDDAVAKMRDAGVTIDPKAVAKFKAELEKGSEEDRKAIKLLEEMGDNPLGLKPIKLDESTITSAPQDAKRRALFLALDNWIQTSPDERAMVVEHLRDQGEMPARRAATILALFVQFEDTVREALADESSCGGPQT